MLDFRCLDPWCALALIDFSVSLSHPKSGMWPVRGKHTPMPPKPWPTSYLLKIRHDLAHSGRLPTCKQYDPQAVIYHTSCTQSISIVNYIFINIILNVYNIIICQSSFYLTYATTTLHIIKETTQDTLDDSTRILHQAMTSCQSSPCSLLDNVSCLRGVVEGPGRSISVKKTTKQWVKHSVSKHNYW